MKTETIQWTHMGRAYGVVPIYLDMRDAECPTIEGAFFGCNLLLSFFNALFFLCVIIRRLVEPDFEPMMPILLTHTIEWEDAA